jgi:hypothetical protein
MVAADGANGYGYSEQRFAADRYQVIYESPSLDLPEDEAARAQRLEVEKARAYDLALWRATQIAIAGGFGYLKVETERRDAAVDVKRQYVPVPAWSDSFYGPGGTLSPPYWFYDWPRPMGSFTYYPDPFAIQQVKIRATGQITADLTVSLSQAPAPGYQDAAALGRQLAARYAGASYP